MRVMKQEADIIPGRNDDMSSWRSATVTELRLAARDYGDEPEQYVGFRIARNLE